MTGTTVLDVLTLVNALGCGLIAGFFYAFSFCVMKSLGRLAPAQGIAAMQTINVVVLNLWFLIAFFGTAVGCVLGIIASVSGWQDPRAGFWLAGGLLYLVGTILVTILFNVPRNDALAEANPASAEAATLWATYLSGWTAWNHVRMVAALAAAVSFTLAFRLRAP